MAESAGTLAEAFVRIRLDSVRADAAMATMQAKINAKMSEISAKSKIRIGLDSAKASARLDKFNADLAAKSDAMKAKSKIRIDLDAKSADIKLGSLRKKVETASQKSQFRIGVDKQKAAMQMQLLSERIKTQAAKTSAAAKIRPQVDPAQANAGLSKFRGAFQNRMAGFQKMATIAISVVGLGVGIRGIFNMGKSLLFLSDRIEMAKNSYSTLLGGGEKAMRQAEALVLKSQSFTAETPFTEEMTRGAITAMLPFSNSMDDLFEKITSIGQAASVSAEGFRSMPRITRAIMQMYSKGQIMAQEMNIQLAEAGIPAWQSLARAIGTTVPEAKKLSEQGKLGVAEIDKLVKQLGKDYAGNMEKQSGTVMGLMSTIKDLRTRIASALGPMRKLIIDAITPLANFIKSDAIVGFFDGVRAKVQIVADTIRAAFQSPLAKAAMKFGAIVLASGVLVGLLTAMQAALMAVAPIAAPILVQMIALGTAVWAIKAAWDAAMSSDKAEAIKQDLRDIWTNLKLIWENVKTTFGNVVAKIRESFGGVGGDVKDKIGGAVQSVTGMLNTLTTWLGVFSSNWQATWDIIKLSTIIELTKIKEFFVHIANNWQTVLAAIVDVAMIQWGAIAAGLGAAFQAIEWDKLGEVFGNLVKVWMAHQYGMITGLGQTFSWIINNWKDLLTRMLDAWFKMSTTIPRLIRAAITAGFTDSTIGDEIAKELAATFAGIGDAFQVGKKAADQFSQGYQDGFSKAKDYLGVTQGIGEAMGEIGSQAGNAAMAAAAAAMNDAKERLAKLRDALAFEESEQLKGYRADRAAKIQGLRDEYARRKKQMEEQAKIGEAAKEGMEEAADGWGDKAADAAAGGGDKGKKESSTAVGIIELQKKMQDIFGGADTRDPVVKALDKTNAHLAGIGNDVKKIVEGKGGIEAGGNDGKNGVGDKPSGKSPAIDQDYEARKRIGTIELPAGKSGMFESIESDFAGMMGMLGPSQPKGPAIGPQMPQAVADRLAAIKARRQAASDANRESIDAAKEQSRIALQAASDANRESVMKSRQSLQERSDATRARIAELRQANATPMVTVPQMLDRAPARGPVDSLREISEIIGADADSLTPKQAQNRESREKEIERRRAALAEKHTNRVVQAINDNGKVGTKE